MAQPAQNVLVSTAVAIIIHVDEACAYLLFWTVVALSLDTLDIPPFRVLGIGGLIYAGSSLIWVAAGSHIADMGGALGDLGRLRRHYGPHVVHLPRDQDQHRRKRSPRRRILAAGTEYRQRQGGARRSRQHHRLHRRTMRGALGALPSDASGERGAFPARSRTHARLHSGRAGALRQHRKDPHFPYLREARRPRSSGSNGPGAEEGIGRFGDVAPRA